MKILYDHQAFSIQKYGGITRYFSELISRVTVNRNSTYVSAGLYKSKYLLCLRNRVNLFLGCHVGIEIPKLGYLRRTINSLVSELLILLVYPDLIHETYFKSRSYFFTRKSKLVITVHDMIHEKFPESFSRYNRGLIRKKRALRRVSGIICVSENTKLDLLELYPELIDLPIRVIYHGYNSNIFKFLPHIHHERANFLFVGSRSGYKNFHNMFEAFKLLWREGAPIKLIVATGHPLTRVEELSFRSESFNVEFHFGLNDSELCNLYNSCGVFIYPSLYEGFGMPILEAMACNIQVICANTSSLPEVGGEGAIYFNPSSVDDILIALRNYLAMTDEELSHRLKTQQLHLKKFSWENTAKQTLKFYEELK